MTSVRSYGCSRRKRFSVTPLNSSLRFEERDKLFDQPNAPAVAFAAAFIILKYTKEDLQRIFKTVLKV